MNHHPDREDTVSRRLRSRRSCLLVPAGDAAAVRNARQVEADEVVLDLVDAPDGARGTVVEALLAEGWAGQLRTVRVHPVSSPHCYRDVIEVVEGAGQRLDSLVLPHVQAAAQVGWLDLLLTQVEAAAGLPPGAIGSQAQLDDASGFACLEAVAAGSERLEALVLDPDSLAAATGQRARVEGLDGTGWLLDQMIGRAVLVARAHSLQVLESVRGEYSDVDGSRRAAALGVDGAWLLDAAEVEPCNALFHHR